MKLSETIRVPMARPGVGCEGQRIQLQSNHFEVKVSKTKGYFCQSTVAISYEDGKSVGAKGIVRKVLDQVHKKYAKKFNGKPFAYDGEKSIITFGDLPRKHIDFTVVLEELSYSTRNVGTGSPDRKRRKGPVRSKTYNVAITYATKIPMQAILDVLSGKQSEHCQEAVRVLDVILRQRAAKQGCLLVRQSFFRNEPGCFDDIGDAVFGCRGFHSSFRATNRGLSLNTDVSTTVIIKSGPVLDFLLENQNIKDPSDIVWSKAKRVLKNLRIKSSSNNLEYKIIGVSDRICKRQKFLMKQKNKDYKELTVYKYFVEYRRKELPKSGDLPCLIVGRPKHPTFLPIEVCKLLPLQRYTKSLTYLQRTSFVEKSRQNPKERMDALKDALKKCKYNADPLLKDSGISISNEFAQVEGRILEAPKLMVGKGQNFVPRHGRWNFNNRELWQPIHIKRWIIVNFSDLFHDVPRLYQRLITCAGNKGISLSNPIACYKESLDHSRETAPKRVEMMFEKNIKKRQLDDLQLILCILPDKKNSDLYGPWKKKNLSELGIVTQCIAPTKKINDQYLTSVLLKINAKMGGINSLLSIEHNYSIPFISNVPTIILGMDVSHGSPGQDTPSIAAVVCSRGWPFISRYRAWVRTQSPKTEMIDALFKKVSDTKDEGIFREVLEDFNKQHKRKPEQIIIFRDGVSESQFTQVLNIELEQIIQACKLFDDTWSPKFLVIIAQKNHHTRFFQVNSPEKNVPPGTVIDNEICHPQNNDFYMCAHDGRIGTSRPIHYHVLHDEIGFSADDVQELVHYLSYVNQRSTTAVSLVAPVYYAHHAAAQVSKFIKFDDFSETSSSNDSRVPELPRLHYNVRRSMFFV